MNPVGKTTAAAGAAGSLVVIIVWMLSLKNITVPADVAVALGVIFSTSAHYIAALLTREGVPVPTPEDKPAPPQIVRVPAQQ